MSASTSQAAPAWRTFSFFNALAVHDRNQPGAPPSVFKSASEVSTIATGQGSVVVADIHGQLHLCSPDFDVIKTWTAHVDGRVTHAKYAGTKGILVTLGEEDGTAHPVLQVWNVRNKGAPRLLASGKVQHGTRSHPVSVFAMTPSLSLVAIGMADGTVLLLRQLDQYIQTAAGSATSATPAGLPKPKLIHSSPSDPITGLCFRTGNLSSSVTANTITGSGAAALQNTAPTADAKNNNTLLFIVTTHQVLTYTMTSIGKALLGSSAHAVVMDDVGAALGCSTMLTSSSELVLARDEAIFVYGPEGRGQSYFYEGPKSAVTCYSNYILITSPPFIPTSASQSATVRNFVREQRAVAQASALASYDTSTDIAKVTIFDPENRFVAFSGAFPDGVREVFAEWGDIFVLTNSSKLHRLVEQSTQAKLDALFAKNLYILAVNLARSSSADEGEIADIYRRYGDHLYDKADFDGAMSQYMKTIGTVQPSYVIRRFLDGQRINNLTSYLQELHTQKLANSDITTLLLNCYAKLKDATRLDEFVKTASASASGELPFDLETAIRVCRQAGYFDHAVYLAKTFDQPDEYLRIQIEDRHEWTDALLFIRSCDQDRAEAYLRRYGKTLLAAVPDAATRLFVDLCCGTLDSLSVELTDDATNGGKKPASSSRSYLSYLALQRPSGSADTQSAVYPANGSPARRTGEQRSAVPLTRLSSDGARVPTGVASVQGQDDEFSGMERPISTISTSTDVLPALKVPLPAVRQFFAHFIDAPANFVTFLEKVATTRWSDPSTGETQATGVDMLEQQAVWNTLIELYLSRAESEAEQRSALEEKALRLINRTGELPIDTSQVLLVCTSANFVPGMLAIYEQLGMYEDILRFWMDRSQDPSTTVEDSRKVVEVLRKYGGLKPELYPLTLRYLTSSSDILGRHHPDLLSILDHIDREKLMPPIAVIQSLSRSGVATVGMVKDYLQRSIVSEQEEIDADRSLAESYRTDLISKEKEIAEMTDPKNPRVFQVTRCSACGGGLDLPAVHFMCKHSYHQRCLADNEASCPNCAANHGVILEIKAANDQLAGRHDLYMQELEDADDRFESVVSAFSRGLITVDEEQRARKR